MTKTIICEEHGEQEVYVIENTGADGIRDDMEMCKICRNQCRTDLGVPEELLANRVFSSFNVNKL